MIGQEDRPLFLPFFFARFIHLDLEWKVLKWSWLVCRRVLLTYIPRSHTHTHVPGMVYSYVKVWSGVLRAEGVGTDEQDRDVVEGKARASFRACVCAINAVNSVICRLAAGSEVRTAILCHEAFCSAVYAPNSAGAARPPLHDRDVDTFVAKGVAVLVVCRKKKIRVQVVDPGIVVRLCLEGRMLALPPVQECCSFFCWLSVSNFPEYVPNFVVSRP